MALAHIYPSIRWSGHDLPREVSIFKSVYEVVFGSHTNVQLFGTLYYAMMK